MTHYLVASHTSKDSSILGNVFVLSIESKKVHCILPFLNGSHIVRDQVSSMYNTFDIYTLTIDDSCNFPVLNPEQKLIPNVDHQNHKICFPYLAIEKTQQTIKRGDVILE